MLLRQSVSRLKARLGTIGDKLRWGIDTVGVRACAIGAVRMLALRLLRPRRSEIKLKSGPVLEFAYPGQTPTVLVLFADYIDPEFAFLQGIARPTWVVADVGAAIGQFTVFAGSLPCGMIHAFEPSSANVATLRGNVARNRIGDRVKIHQIALSSSDGEAAFSTASTYTGQLTDAEGAGIERVAVKTLAGELERNGIDRIDVLKLNVAGFEPSVIEGAMPYLAFGKIDILILLLGLASLPWYERLAHHGYRFFYFHPLERTLYEVVAFDEASVLDHRPWPARHIIAIHETAIANGIVSSLTLRKL